MLFHKISFIFSATAQHMLVYCFRNPVRLSVCHTGDPRLNLIG